jgi:hypothetical protein
LIEDRDNRHRRILEDSTAHERHYDFGQNHDHENRQKYRCHPVPLEQIQRRVRISYDAAAPTSPSTAGSYVDVPAKGAVDQNAGPAANSRTPVAIARARRIKRFDQRTTGGFLDRFANSTGKPSAKRVLACPPRARPKCRRRQRPDQRIDRPRHRDQQQTDSKAE